MSMKMTISERKGIESLLSKHHEKEIAKINASDPGWRDRIEARKRKVAIVD